MRLRLTLLSQRTFNQTKVELKCQGCGTGEAIKAFNQTKVELKFAYTTTARTLTFFHQTKVG